MEKFKRWGDALWLAIGATLFGAGFHMFLLPNRIVLGGATGVATVLNLLFGLPVGVMTVAVNLPLLVLSFLLEGRGGVGRAVLGIAATSVAVDALSFLPALTSDTLIAAACGGGVAGFGLALALMRGFTSGGSDLAAYLIRLRLHHLSFGQLVMVIDGVIVAASALIFRDFSGIFYSAVSILTFSSAVDITVRQSKKARLALLICPLSEADELARAIADGIHRGITTVPAHGWYSGEGRKLLLCAVKPAEGDALADTVRRICPTAFLIFLSAPEVRGYRFCEEPVDNSAPL